jgi:hypothetical protein
VNPDNLSKEIPLIIDGLSLMAIHGACCLALRHPGWTGPSRKLVLDFVDKAEKSLKEIGAFNDEDIELIHRVEQEEIPHVPDDIKGHLWIE